MYPFMNASTSAPAIRQLLDIACPIARDASLVVHPADDMYAFGVNTIGNESLAAMSYFRAGTSMIDVIDSIAEWHFDGLEHVDSFLDFAGGYGRSTRFLVRCLPPQHVTVGEIQAEALGFQAREFGVRTLQSTTDPADLVVPQTYGFVYVASLFTHLPRHTFAPWLARLWEMVNPGGVFVFSVHDEVLNDRGAALEDGFVFFPTTEIAGLDTADYGANFTTETFVRAQLDEAIGGSAEAAIRLPQALCFHQDLWVIPKGRRNPGALRYECGPSGGLDGCALDGRTIALTGWAADAGLAAPDAPSHRIARIAIACTDGTRIDADLGQLHRPDVAAHFHRAGDPNYEYSGWQARGRLQRYARPDDILTVTAVCAHDHRFVLDATRLDDLLQRTGGTLPPYVGPIERRLQTAIAVHNQGGLGGLVALAPTVARHESRRLAQALRRSRGN